jgi:RNA polymerase sigma-70 factor (family 1)
LAIVSIINERELLLEVAKGNEKAFAELFYAYHGQLGEYITLLTASGEMAEEIVQDVFVKIWLNKEALPGIDKFPAYLFILTRNYTLNCIRKIELERRRKESYGMHLVTAEDSENTEDNQDYQDVVERAVAQLPAQQQKVFILKREGKKNGDIAQELGISPDSVRKYQQWAIKSIAKFVKSHQELTSLLFLLGYLKK